MIHCNNLMRQNAVMIAQRSEDRGKDADDDDALKRYRTNKIFWDLWKYYCYLPKNKP